MKNPPGIPQIEREQRKAANRARYERRYARNQPEAPKVRAHDVPYRSPRLTPRERALITIQGVPQYLQMVARSMFGPKGTWGHGLQANGTKSGPGRRPIPRLYRLGEGSPLLERDHPAGTKFVRRFIRSASNEAVHWRRLYADLTGKQYG